MRLPVLSPGRAEWNSQGVLTPGLLANQKSKPWRGDRDAGVLENVAICVPPSGVRFPAKTHHWGWHPRLLHATPPAFRPAPAAVPFVGCIGRFPPVSAMHFQEVSFVRDRFAQSVLAQLSRAQSVRAQSVPCTLQNTFARKAVQLPFSGRLTSVLAARALGASLGSGGASLR